MTYTVKSKFWATVNGVEYRGTAASIYKIVSSLIANRKGDLKISLVDNKGETIPWECFVYMGTSTESKPHFYIDGDSVVYGFTKAKEYSDSYLKKHGYSK